MVEKALQPSVAMLKEIQLLKVFSDHELQELLSLGELRKYESYGNIIIEGEMTWGLFLILSGTVGILKNNHLSGNSYDVGQLEMGGFFGEMSLVDENPRSATVRSLTDSTMFFLSKEKFNSFLAKAPDRVIRFYQSCIKTLVQRLRELDENYVTTQYQLWKNALKTGKDVA